MSDVVESTLWIGGSCSCLQVPPVSGERILSGNWRTDATIATNQRIRITSIGDTARVYIESKDTGELFAMCVIAAGKKDACVMAAIDSSRNFMVRLEDAETGRHAFIGLSFTDRGDAFDFNVALSDHQRQVLAGQAGSSEQKPNDVPELTRDLSLQDGQTIRVALKGQKPRWLSGGGGAAASPGLAVPLIQPPPSVGAGFHPRMPALPQTSSALKASSAPQVTPSSNTDPFGALASVGQSTPPLGAQAAPPPGAHAASASAPQAPTDRQGWTTF